MDSDTIKEDVEKARIAAGLSFAEFSLKTGISRTTLRRKLEAPGLMTFDEYKAIDRVLHISQDAA